MRNEWRSNLWLTVELLIVSVVIWYVFAFTWSLVKFRFSSAGFDLEDCYYVDFARIPDYSPNFDASFSNNDQENTRQLNEIVRRIRELPQVDGVGMGMYGALPYNFNFNGDVLKIHNNENEDSVFEMLHNMKWMTPELVRIMRLRGIKGESPEELARLLAEDYLFTSSNVMGYGSDYDMSRFADEWKITMTNNSKLYTPVVLEPMRRNDFEPASYPTGIVRLDENLPNLSRWASQMVVRVKPGTDAAFLAHMKENMDELYHVGNTYVRDVYSIDVLRESVQRSFYQLIWRSVVSVAFLLGTVFLGLLGTFWFRTQQRIGEIAIRKVNGATSGSIFRRLINEGLLLLVVAAVFALAVEWVLYDYDLLMGAYVAVSLDELCVMSLASFALVAVMIIFGIFFPARKAMKIDASEALKSE